MNLSAITENLLNPALLFFILGVIAIQIKSDLDIPTSSSRFISLYLLFAIGFKGGVALSHEGDLGLLFLSILFGLTLAMVIPILVFYITRRKFGAHNAGAIAAAYGSVSVVTVVTAYGFLESRQISPPGHFTVIMALMEFPAIIIGLALIHRYTRATEGAVSFRQTLHHSLTNGSVVIIAGSLVIGMLSSDEQALGIKPFTNDLFKGFLAIFLLDMGLKSGRKLKAFFSYGWAPLIFAVLIPLCNGVLAVMLSTCVTSDVAGRFLFAVLAASASYIAVPAAMKINAPQADEGLYVPMALAVTFPVNIGIGLPLYYCLAQV